MSIQKSKSLLIHCTVLFTVGLFATGCESSSESAPVENTTQVVDLQLTDQQKANLAAADKLDGKEDKVVHRCYSCALGMDGKSQYAAKVGDYELHFCREGCTEHFVESPSDLLTETEVPSK